MDKIPAWWQTNPNFRSRTALLESRKPKVDPTFDLDGDGAVGAVDLFVSSFFDKDKDGKLNAQEREAAESGLKAGFLDNFELGLDSSGIHKANRQVQLRGIPIVDDDFSRIKNTYPLQRAQSQRTYRTLTELKQKRKEEARNIALESAENHHTFKNPIIVLPCAVPKITEEEITYVKDPKHKSCTQLKLARKKEPISCNFSHISSQQRLIERENLIKVQNQGITYNDIVSEMRRKDHEHNVKVFANISLGIHGNELPKFRENAKEYWKNAKGYTERAPPITEKEEPRVYFRKKLKTEVSDKPNNMHPSDSNRVLFERLYSRPTVKTFTPELPKPETSSKYKVTQKSIKNKPTDSRYNSINANRSSIHNSMNNRPISSIYQNLNTNRQKTVRTAGFRNNLL